MTTDVLIVGGGLSGLHTAFALHRRGVDALVVEARDRLGGRILSRRPAKSDDVPAFDLGPTWFWPAQHRMEALVRALGLETRVFDQQSQGEALYEDPTGAVHRGLSGVSMAGSFRMEGGLAEIITALARRMPAEMLECGSRVTGIDRRGDRLLTTVHRDGRDRVVDSARVVIALPPRLAARSIALSPALPKGRAAALKQTPTWMAGHAKLIALYDEPFWRADGLSGDAISYRGPLGEIHDASPPAGGPAALFGFLGIPASVRDQLGDGLQAAAVAQLERLFGCLAAQPRDVWFKDWAGDPLTATEEDRGERHEHPPPWSGEPTESTWDDRLLWAGSETATGSPRNNGYLEGALEASERTVDLICPPET